MTRKREVLASEDISDLPPPSHRHQMSGEPIWDQHAVRAMLSKLRAPVADERISLRGAANLAFNALHECKPVKGAEKQYSDAIQALQSALHDIAYTVNRTATPQQFADHLQREARAALASAPVADESPMAKMAEALREKARQEQRAYQDRRDQATEWGPMPAGTEADDPSALAALADGLESIVGNENAELAAVIIRRMASALASAPAQPQACPTDVCQAAKADGVLCANGECDRANGVRPASAPVAGEAQPVAYLTLDEEGSPCMLFFDVVEARTYCALGEEPVPLFLHAAPQASEAVRDALWTLTEHNALHFGEQHNTVIQGRAALSAQPDAEPLSNPKQFALTAADERTAFETTYQADYDDPGAACEREHFGKGFRAGLAAQSAKEQGERDA